MAGRAVVRMALLIPILTWGRLLVTSTAAIVIMRRHGDFGSKLVRLIEGWDVFWSRGVESSWHAA